MLAAGEEHDVAALGREVLAAVDQQRGAGDRGRLQQEAHRARHVLGRAGHHHAPDGTHAATVAQPVKVDNIGYQRLRGTLLTSSLAIGPFLLKDFQLVISGILMLLIILFIPAGLVGWLRWGWRATRRAARPRTMSPSCSR